MSVEAASWVVAALAGYLAGGVVFGIAFVLRGAAHIDPAAPSLPTLARLLILPGAAALWPLLLFKWLTHRPLPAP